MSAETKLKTALYKDCRKICRETGAYMNVEYDEDSMDLISELLWKKLQLFGQDLEAFAKHAKRATINTDDVKLLVRRNDSLTKMVEEKIQALQNSKTTAENSGGLKRKRSTTSAKT